MNKKELVAKPQYAIPRTAFADARERLRALWGKNKNKPTKLGFMLSERNIAKYYGISQSMVNHLRNRQDMNIYHVKMFAEIFGVPPATIFPEIFEGVDLATPNEAKASHFSESFSKCPPAVQEAILLLMKPYAENQG